MNVRIQKRVPALGAHGVDAVCARAAVPRFALISSSDLQRLKKTVWVSEGHLDSWSDL